MKIFLSAIENQRDSKANGGTHAVKLLVDHGVKMKWNLMSYYRAIGNRLQRVIDRYV